MTKIVNSFVFTALFSISAAAKTPFGLSTDKLNEIEERYGERAKKRIQQLGNMIELAKEKDRFEQLRIVNDFFNKVQYKKDLLHWKHKDYWASPIEFLGTGAGDCEDYAIAKYYALREIGVPSEKLKISYVKLINEKTYKEQAHIILEYFDSPASIPIVLDNAFKHLRLVSQRSDLKKVRSRNIDTIISHRLNTLVF